MDPAGGSFGDLLRAAEEGQISSGAPVTIAKSAGVSLSSAQLGKLATAADRAQAAGADRALVLMDGMAMQLDVATRTITGLAKVAPGTKLPQVLTGVDTVITVPSDEDAAPLAAPLAQLSASGTTNASLMRVLAGAQGAAASANDNRAA